MVPPPRRGRGALALGVDPPGGIRGVHGAAALFGEWREPLVDGFVAPERGVVASDSGVAAAGCAVLRSSVLWTPVVWSWAPGGGRFVSAGLGAWSVRRRCLVRCCEKDGSSGQ